MDETVDDSIFKNLDIFFTRCCVPELPNLCSRLSYRRLQAQSKGMFKNREVKPSCVIEENMHHEKHMLPTPF
jgi:hypothetical protein